MAPVIIESHVTAWGLGCYQGPYWSLATMLLLSRCQSERLKLLLLAMSGSVVLLKLGFVLMSVVCITTGSHVNHVLNHEV